MTMHSCVMPTRRDALGAVQAAAVVFAAALFASSVALVTFALNRAARAFPSQP
jgi:hypothetical protein